MVQPQAACVALRSGETNETSHRPTRAIAICSLGAAAVAAALALAACGGGNGDGEGGGGGGGEASGTLTVALDADAAPTGYDPLLYSQGQFTFFSGMYDALFVTDADGEVQPSLATEFSNNPETRRPPSRCGRMSLSPTAQRSTRNW